MKSMLKYTGLLMMTLVLICTFAACTSNEPAPAPAPAPTQSPTPSPEPATPTDTSPIKIGFFAPLTAPSAAADGLSAQNSADLAVKLLNAAGGINGRPVELVSYDDGLDTTQATSIAEKLTTKDGVVAVVSGSYSGPTRVAAPIFQEAGLVMVSAYAVHPEVVNSGEYIFSQSFPGKVQGKAGAEFVVNQLGCKKIAIIVVDLDFGTQLGDTFKDYAESQGATIVSYDKVAISDNEFAPVVTKLKNQDIDAIYIANYYAHAAEVVNQCAVQGINVPIIGTEGADSWQFLRTAGANAEGVYLTTNMDRDSKDAATQAYIKNYRDEYDMEPDMVGASAYDALQVIFAAIEAVGTDPAAMQAYVAGMTDFETVTGNLIRYTNNGSAVKPVQIQQVQDGAFHYYSVITDEGIITPES